LWSNWVVDPVLQVFEERTPFKYLQLFGSREEMAAWALAEKEEIERRCDVLDAAVGGWSLGSSASHLTALALHSFLLNTWWTMRRDGRDWFSVWQGSSHYHSTIDVEYNDGLFYLALWPELLRMQLEEWADFEVDGKQTLGKSGEDTSFLCHDMGSDYVVGRQMYPHHMEVEENANYLLLLAAWAFLTGETTAAAGQLPLCRRLAEFIVQSDTDGNGVPDTGTANAVEDASAAVQFGREQVYLAIKAQAALWALAELEQKCGVQDSQAERWRAAAAKSTKFVEEEAWLDDHYAVALAGPAEETTDPPSGHRPEGELAGWDGYSIYTANGLLYLFLGGIKTPRWRLNRFAEDIENATRAMMTPYGSRHSDVGDGNVWFSQNMWRDYVAAYLGVDLLNNVERYWDYQLATGESRRSSLYYDSTEGDGLSFHPRGVTIFGMAASAAGMSVNRIDSQLTLRPVRTTLTVPLLPLADWEGMRVPVLTVRNREGVAVARISEEALLEGLTVRVIGAELEPH
ncbi:MAG: glutaminase domain-containing protein, partial [Planctomycetota bacterium]